MVDLRVNPTKIRKGSLVTGAPPPTHFFFFLFRFFHITSLAGGLTITLTATVTGKCLQGFFFLTKVCNMCLSSTEGFFSNTFYYIFQKGHAVIISQNTKIAIKLVVVLFFFFLQGIVNYCSFLWLILCFATN